MASCDRENRNEVTDYVDHSPLLFAQVRGSPSASTERCGNETANVLHTFFLSNAAMSTRLFLSLGILVKDFHDRVSEVRSKKAFITKCSMLQIKSSSSYKRELCKYGQSTSTVHRSS